MKKLGIFQRPLSASLRDTPKNPAKGEKRSAPSPPLEKTTKRGKGGPSPSDAQVATRRPPNKQGDWPVLRLEVLEVLSIRRTRKGEVLRVLKKGGDVLAFRKQLDQAVGGRAEISAQVSTRSLEIRDLNETFGKKEVVSALCLALGSLALDGPCRPFTRFGGVKTTVIRLAETEATRLLQLGKIKIGWVACRIREHADVARCFRCHGSRGCRNPDRKNACWRCGATRHLARCCKATPKCLTCFDRGDKDIAHASGGCSCLIFREELRRLRGRN